MTTRDEAVEAMTGTDRAHGRYTITEPPIRLVCRCGWEASVGPTTLDAQWRVHVMERLLDALTKPRTEKCEKCGGTGLLRNEEVRRDGSDTPDVACPSCSGSGTVTRGPIAVLVPPDAVEIMARAIGEDTYAGNAKRTEEGMTWLRRYAKAALDALYRRTREGGDDGVRAGCARFKQRWDNSHKCAECGVSFYGHPEVASPEKEPTDG
jgi:DNA-directed RNA polymerase subunit RPC12/RpoP